MWYLHFMVYYLQENDFYFISPELGQQDEKWRSQLTINGHKIQFTIIAENRFGFAICSDSNLSLLILEWWNAGIKKVTRCMVKDASGHMSGVVTGKNSIIGKAVTNTRRLTEVCMLMVQ